GEDKEALLFEWLSYLLVQFDLLGVVYSKFVVHKIEDTPEGYGLKATIWGEPLDLQKHQPKVEVKAVTYARMEIEEEPGRVTLRFVLDI
ncbi:MAG: archease, partial [Candidatus Bathyarchaeia archaeon]